MFCLHVVFVFSPVGQLLGLANIICFIVPDTKQIFWYVTVRYVILCYVICIMKRGLISHHADISYLYVMSYRTIYNIIYHILFVMSYIMSYHIPMICNTHSKLCTLHATGYFTVTQSLTGLKWPLWSWLLITYLTFAGPNIVYPISN